MNEEFQDPPSTIKELFRFYTYRVKPIYAEIEARNNLLPVELLLEVFAAFDHIKRFYVDEVSEKDAVSSTFSHLKRGLLDAFKLKLKYYNADYEGLQKDARLFPLIDNGEFTRTLQHNRKMIIQAGKQARLCESKTDLKHAFDNWEKTSLLIDAFYDNFFGNNKLLWAKTLEKKLLWIERLKSGVVGLVLGLVVAYIAHLLGW